MTRIEQAVRQSLGEIIPEVFRAAEEMRQRRAGAQGVGVPGWRLVAAPAPRRGRTAQLFG